MGKVTAADVVLTLAIETIFNVPQQLQGFAADDVQNMPQVRSAEVMMGVDGVMSSGFVFVPTPQEITLQADSLANLIFEAWNSQQQSTKATYRASGLMIVPAISRKYIMNGGVMTGYPPSAQTKRLLQPRKYEITWESVIPAPI